MSASLVARGPSNVRMRFKAGLVGKTGDNTLETSQADAQAGTGTLGRMSARRTADAINAQVPALLVNLPTTLPSTPGQLWWNGGVLSLS